MKRTILLTAILSLVLMGVATALPALTKASEVDLALAVIGSGSAAEMSSRIFTTPVTVLGAEHRTRAVAALPEQIRTNRVTEGSLLRRVEAITRSILQLHNRGQDVELFLYRGDAPRGMLVNGCLLVLSDSLVRPLHDMELAGIIAHEMGHRYFMDEMRAALEADDERVIKAIELQCDAVAILTLKLIGYDPAIHISGLRKVETAIKAQGYLILLHGRSHPTTAERAQFARRLVKLLV